VVAKLIYPTATAITQIFSISENSNTVGIKFDLIVQVECARGTPRTAFKPPRFDFSNMVQISFNAEEGWHPEKVDEAFQYVEQATPFNGDEGIRAFYRLNGEIVGTFIADMQLESFPFDVSNPSCVVCVWRVCLCVCVCVRVCVCACVCV
jgi:hypothetical protein